LISQYNTSNYTFDVKECCVVIIHCNQGVKYCGAGAQYQLEQEKEVSGQFQTYSEL
jgi:hypothetical protein